METIVIIKNQTIGGGDRYCNNVVFELKKKYLVKIFTPLKFEAKSQLSIIRLLQYIKYVYFYLPRYYKKIGINITKNKKYKKIIVFQDAFRKCPDIFRFLNKKSAYILHEPPREFYEPISLHAPSLKDKLFTLLIRGPIFFIDRVNTKKASMIIANSEFSKVRIKKIYKRNSSVIYPGVSILSNKKLIRKFQCISVGSLLPYKGHATTIEAISQMTNKKPLLVIVGSGTVKQKKEMFILANKYKVKIKIISNPTDKLLGTLYLKSLVYINCAYHEPFGMTALEGLGHGCSLVTVNKCGTEELKKFFPDTVYVSNGEVRDISRKIESALDSDRKKYDLENYTWSRVAKAIITLLDK